ncbi:unnamed protein product [Leptidea sinapis]|uniref:Uncharacterized protein n=1 Tax=Leptidea sinapis TaxID=189913 RepID=A0A5E4QUW1_9NEOP|nr:unnamed protein product [Leptidea sinapis]
MDVIESSTQSNPRKIEDIIDIQKASGNINARQVLFQVSSETDSTSSTSELKNFGRIGQTHRVKKSRSKIKSCKIRSCDITSWPSDSDVTVLRMRLCLRKGVNERDVTGDGKHQPNSSSMVNLATLMMQSPRPSKCSLFEELLLPITSWEGSDLKSKGGKVEKETIASHIQVDNGKKINNAKNVNSSHSYDQALDVKSKLARFFRFYFCSCCKCLYNLENMQN